MIRPQLRIQGNVTILFGILKRKFSCIQSRLQKVQNISKKFAELRCGHFCEDRIFGIKNLKETKRSNESLSTFKDRVT